MYKKAFWIGLIIPAIQQLTGINAIMYYAAVIFDSEPYKGSSTAKVLTFVTMLINFLATFVAAFVSDKLGRRLLFIAGSIGCGLSLLLATIGSGGMDSDGVDDKRPFYWTFAIGVFIFTAFFGLSHGPVWYFPLLSHSWVYMSEILPSQWMGYGTASSWVFTILVTITVPPMLNSIGYVTYLIFLVCMVLVSFFVEKFSRLHFR